MYKDFLTLQWKAFFRSADFGKSLGLKIFMAFMAIYFMIIFLLLGIGLYPMLQKFFPEEEPLAVVNRFVLVWFGSELVMRFMLQSLPVISIKPFLLMPVKKRKLVDYVLLRSLFSFFNFLPLLVIIPFAVFTGHRSNITFPEIFGWTLSIYAISISLNYLNFLLKKKFSESIQALLPYLGLVLVLALLEYFKVFSATEAFGKGLTFIITYPFLSVFPVLLAFALYLWNRKILKRRFYLDDSLSGKKEEVSTQEFQWLRRFGRIAPFLQLDLKLIWRNKRPRTTIFLSLLMIPYGLLIFSNAAYEGSFIMQPFAGILMTGIFMVNFGQFIPAWDASYYAMMMSQNIRLKDYLASKAGLMSASVLLLAILSTPYLYFGIHVFLIIIACAIYNIGINVPMLLFAGSFNRKRIDLEKSPFMNYQGTGAAQWLVGIPLMVLPVLFVWIVQKFTSVEVAVGALGALGLIGLVFRDFLMGQIQGAYEKNKYAMINGFKQTGE